MRKAKGWRLIDLAQHSGIREVHLSYVERGTREVGLNTAACDSVASALRFLAARQWPVPPRILIAGSLYLAGEVLEANDSPPR